MHRLITSSLALSLLASVSAGALAQEPAVGDIVEDMPEAVDEGNAEAVDPVLPADPEKGPPAPPIPESADIPPQQPSVDDPAEVVVPDEFIGKTVFDLADEEIGTVTDFVINDAGEPAAVVEFGGFLGLGTKEVAVPTDLFRPREQESVFVTLTEQDLADMYEVAQKKAQEAGDS